MTAEGLMQAVRDLLMGGGLGAAALMGLLEIAPIKLNPWSAIARAIGNAVNADLLKELANTKSMLQEHIEMDDKRNADMHRWRILNFNNELLQDVPHTREDFIDILAEIDEYEDFCKNHPDYKNNRATHAIGNIGRVYDDRLKKHDFL